VARYLLPLMAQRILCPSLAILAQWEAFFGFCSRKEYSPAFTNLRSALGVLSIRYTSPLISTDSRSSKIAS
jgi:hypothetical protein